MHEEENDIFADYATSTGFNLWLSKHMIITLTLIYNRAVYSGRMEGDGNIYKALGAQDRFDQTAEYLVRRGLIFEKALEDTTDDDEDYPYTLTREGLLVFELLKSARVVQIVKQVLEKNAA